MQTIDVSAFIAGDRCFGTIERVAPDLPWSYRGDTEMCDRCGSDTYTVIPDPDPLRCTLAYYTKQALCCEKCGKTYGLKCEE